MNERLLTIVIILKIVCKFKKKKTDTMINRIQNQEKQRIWTKYMQCHNPSYHI